MAVFRCGVCRVSGWGFGLLKVGHRIPFRKLRHRARREVVLLLTAPGLSVDIFATFSWLLLAGFS